MKIALLVLLLLSCPLMLTSAAAQKPMSPPLPQLPEPPTVGLSSHWPGWEDVERPAMDLNRPAREPRVIAKGPLALSNQDKIDYASFLAQPNTGLIRLLPRINRSSVFADPSKRPDIRGDGAYYSFHFLSHEYGFGSDLEL